MSEQKFDRANKIIEESGKKHFFIVVPYVLGKKTIEQIAEDTKEDIEVVKMIIGTFSDDHKEPLMT